jgi:hypothetical protein
MTTAKTLDCVSNRPLIAWDFHASLTPLYAKNEVNLPALHKLWFIFTTNVRIADFSEHHHLLQGAQLRANDP